jgi:colanic acid biosynthesis glycosyl transferase WcaI
LPSKITNIFASGGNAVITADPMTTLGVLGSDNPGIAVIIEPESMDALLQGIEQALELPLPNLIATAYAKKFLDKDKVLNNFLNKIQA